MKDSSLSALLKALLSPGKEEYGWEFDHNFPSSLGGNGSLSNIRPLHWKANVQKSDTHPGLFGIDRKNLGLQGTQLEAHTLSAQLLPYPNQIPFAFQD